MSMNRRDVLKAGAAFSALAAFPSLPARADFAPRPGNWRNFELLTRLEIAKPAGLTQAWIPLPAFSEPAWFKPAGSTWTTNAKTAEIAKDPKYGAEMLHLAWADGESAPVVEVKSMFATQNRAIDLTKPSGKETLSEAERKLTPRRHRPHPDRRHRQGDGRQDHAGANSDLEKARAIYEWIVDNTFRDRQDPRLRRRRHSSSCSSPATSAASAPT